MIFGRPAFITLHAASCVAECDRVATIQFSADSNNGGQRGIFNATFLIADTG